MNSFSHPLEHDLLDGLVVCVRCFRVRQGARWVDAEEIIRRARTFELPTIPPLDSVLCADCSAEIAERRGVSYDAAAA